MGDFREFIELSEARFRGGAGGAFGNSGGGAFDFSRSRGDTMDMRGMDRRSGNQYQNINSRVETGRALEPKIITALREAGWTVNPSKPNQDKHDKVDAWVERRGKWLPMQIKYRDTGNEIAMEAMLDWHPDRFHAPYLFNGRDMVGGSKLYACLDKGGMIIRVCDAEEAKQAGQEAVRKLAAAFQNSQTRVASTSKAEARITGDPASGRQKVMVFVRPEALTSLQTVPLKASLHAA
jgi:hypothetical protein